MTTRKKRFLVCLLGALGIAATVAPDVAAVVGRPLTPVSVAGVARRTARRNVYYHGGYGGYGY
jgi:hypothetical protein